MSKDPGFPLPSPVTGYPLICVTLKIPDAQQYRQDFLGHIWQLGKWWIWEQSGEAGDTRARDAAQYWRELLANHLVIGECPVDCCDDILAAIAALQTQANDQSSLNLTRDVTNQQIQSQVLRDALEEEYTGDPTSINPDAPTTDFGSSGDRYDALCAGLMAFVYQFARAQVDSVRAGQVGGIAAVALVAALLIPGLNFFLIVGASIAVILGIGTIGVTTEAAIAALTDTEALDEVVCYMRDTLKAQGVSQANWDACLDSYPFGVGTHAAIVADFLKATLHDNYLTILNILGQAYSGVINGNPLPECPCEEPLDPCGDADESYNFRESTHGFVESVGGYAEWHVGEGFGVGSFGFTITVEKVVTENIVKARTYWTENIDGSAFLRNTLANGFSTFTGPTDSGTEGSLFWYEWEIAGTTNGICLQANPASGTNRLVQGCLWFG